MWSENLVKRVLRVGLPIALASWLVTSSFQALARGRVVQAEPATAEAVGSGFTYQGQLLHDDIPVDGICDFEFGLWDDASDGTLVGLQAVEGVHVNEGLFSVELDFGNDAFTGDDRYLEIGVYCEHGYSLLEPRVGLTATPYAHSLRPGASVQSSSGTALHVTTSATSGAALSANASASSGNAAAVYGSSSSPGGAGVSGHSSSGSGVYGLTAGSTGTSHGVYGEATASGGETAGVYGKSSSIEGKGVYGEGRTGVHGYSADGTGVWGSSPDGWGVSGASTNDYGVRGGSTNSIGVFGTGPITGTAGIATASGGDTTGVYGKANSTEGKGVYGEGRTGVHGHSADGVGVWGSSPDDWGVSGTSNNDYGVRGGSTNSIGVYGTAPVTGTAGIATASSGETTGVYGKAESLLGSGVNAEGGYHGVYAVGTDPTGVAHGVYGRTDSIGTSSSGVRGHASSDQGITYGVYGHSNSPSGYGVYSDGPARVEGDLTVAGDLTVLGDIAPSIKTSTVSVAPAAFRPESRDVEHINEGYYLKYEGFWADPPEQFYAPLQLPHNATITKLTACFLAIAETPADQQKIGMGLERGDLVGGSEEMAKEWNPYVPFTTDFCMSDDTIAHPVIDNDNYVYYLYVNVVKDAEFYGMKVEYEYSAP